MKRTADDNDLISPTRLISFSDGVFAIAVTLLVFNLKVPEIPEGDVHRLLPAAMKAMWPHLDTYVISFLLVAVYWTTHHRMLNTVRHVDSRFIWLNLLYLLMIGFIPFPSALMGTYPEERLTFDFYVGSMMLVSLLSLSMWWYATWDLRLVDKNLSPWKVRHYFIRGIFVLAILITAILLSFYNVRWGFYCLGAPFPMQWALRLYFRKKMD